MKISLRSSGTRGLACAALAIVPVLALASPASATPVSVTFDCQANAPVIGPQKTSLVQTADVNAPATVAPNAALDIVVDPGSNTIPATVSGHTIKEVKDFAFRLQIPSNSTYVGAQLTGGSGLGPTAPKITVSGSVATVSFPGPVAGGAQFKLPTLTMHLKAAASGTIETKLAGTSYTDPGLTFTAVVHEVVDVTAPTACFPNPSPVFTRTTIG